ncbi:hypothetical protein ABK040_004882 [Willaertia magna]
MLSNDYYFGNGFITQLISNFYSTTYDICYPDVFTKYLNKLDKEYILDVFHDFSQEEYSSTREHHLRRSDCLMFIINTKASNNVMERIEYFCERVDRMEKSIIFS